MNRPLALLVALLMVVLSAAGQTTSSSLPTWPVDLMMDYSVIPNVTYSTANNFECKLEVYARRASGGPFPTAVHIHGGGWVVGTKESSVMQLMPYLSMGFSAVNVEYRLAKVSLAPAAVEDCRLALRWIFKNAKAYGFDTTRIIITGGSAGGHLALMTGMLDESAGFDAPKEWDQQNFPTPVAAIINWFGITDVKDLLAGPNRQNYAVSWLGSQPNREQLAARVSPLTYVRKGLPPILTIHGDNDNLVPYNHAVRLHKALTEANVPNQLVTVPGGKHGGFTRDQMLSAFATIREFLVQQKILR
ncbi:MAG: alpha/beta hydrolase [Bacteroidota bacterium]